MAARKGRRAAPKGPPLPEEGRHLWNAFTRLHRRRSGTGFGANALALSEIEAHARLYRQPLLAWEVDAICALDDAYLRSRVEEAPKPAPPAIDPEDMEEPSRDG